MSTARCLPACLLCLLGAFLPPAAVAYAPVVVLGLQAEGLLYSDQDQPAEGAAGLGLRGLLAWRTPWAEDGYFSAVVSSSLDWLPDPFYGDAALYDQQLLGLKARLPGSLNPLTAAAGLRGSFGGTLGGELSYLRPDWQLAWRLWETEQGGEGELAARGYYFGQPDGDEDSVYQGLQLAGSRAASIRARYGLLLEVGWELWPEIALVGTAGEATEQRRSDLVGCLEASIGGLAGYFFDWSLTADLGGRLSNANRWLPAEPPPQQLEESTENRLHAGLRAEVRWSPHRQVGLELAGITRREMYPQREALTDGGTLSGETLRVFSAGLDLRADWSPGDRLFFVLEVSAGRRFANETAEERWSLQGGAGVELRL